MSSDPAASTHPNHHLRFLTPHLHLAPVFGSGWFGQKAEQFARFFGTPTFLIIQTVIVLIWIGLNLRGVFHFDPFPFILLNLAFSLQSAYSAPLILLAETRQADRDKVMAEADAQHREALAKASAERQEIATRQQDQIFKLLEQNTELTRITRELTERVEALTRDIHQRTVAAPGQG